MILTNGNNSMPKSMIREKLGLIKYRRIKTIADVASWRFCMGCGACASVCDNNVISLVDIPDHGIRPVVDEQKCEKCGECLNVCPEVGMEYQFNS